MKKLILTTLFILSTITSAYALDGSVSIEADNSFGKVDIVPDLQAQLGQAFGEHRIFISAERTKESEFFPNSDKNYRLGIQNIHFDNITIESGIISYKSNQGVYGKITYSFDTKEKK